MNNKIAILEVYPNEKKVESKNVIDAHLRNSLRLKDLLKCDLLINSKDYINSLNNNYDAFILGYATRYAPYQLIKQLIAKNPTAKKIVISNEYNIAPSIGGFNPYHLITNFEKLTSKGKSVLSHFFVNLNVLIFDYKNITTQKKYSLIYWGTFRENREIYFKKYFDKRIFLSTSPKNMKKFKHIGCDPNYTKKMSWECGRETLRLFKYALYIEDTNTHDNYNCLGNRFYEAVMCHAVLFFDINCKNTVIKSGIILDDFFYVKDSDDLHEKIEKSTYEDLYEKQKHFVNFCKEEKQKDEEKLKNRIFEIVNNNHPIDK